MALTVLRGNNLKVSVGGTQVAKETSCQINLTANLEDVSTKDDSEGWDLQSITSRSWTVQSDAMVSDSGDEAADLLIAWIDQDNTNIPTVSAKIGSTTVVTGSAILTSLEIDATVKQNVTTSATYTGTGALS